MSYQSLGRWRRESTTSCRDLCLCSDSTDLEHHENVASAPVHRFQSILNLGVHRRKTRKQILQGFDGLVPSGEMLLVLGRPGSGCTTLLKTLAGQSTGLIIDEKARISYGGDDREYQQGE